MIRVAMPPAMVSARPLSYPNFGMRSLLTDTSRTDQRRFPRIVVMAETSIAEAKPPRLLLPLVDNLPVPDFEDVDARDPLAPVQDQVIQLHDVRTVLHAANDVDMGNRAT